MVSISVILFCASRFDKILLLMDGSIGGLFLLVNEYLASKSRGWRCDWERKTETAAQILWDSMIDAGKMYLKDVSVSVDVSIVDNWYEK